MEWTEQWWQLLITWCLTSSPTGKVIRGERNSPDHKSKSESLLTTHVSLCLKNVTQNTTTKTWVAYGNSHLTCASFIQGTWGTSLTNVQVQCCLTSTETIRTLILPAGNHSCFRLLNHPPTSSSPLPDLVSHSPSCIPLLTVPTPHPGLLHHLCYVKRACGYT